MDKPATPHWEVLVKTWFDLYEGWYGEKPSFEGADSRNLKAIVTNLQKRSESKGMEWTEEQSASAFTAFLTFARNDKWLKDNFLLQNLNRQFDKIITNAKNSSKSRSVARAFNAIDEMYN